MAALAYDAFHEAHHLRGVLRWHRARMRVFWPFAVVKIGTFLLAGFPLWRLGLMLALGLVSSTLERLAVSAADRSESLRPIVVLAYLGALPATTIMLGLTGGICSPLLVLSFGIPISAMLASGFKRRNLGLVAATALCLLLLGFEPAAWAGPPLARIYFVALTVESASLFMLMVGFEIHVLRSAHKAAQKELDRLRDDSIEQLCERTRSLQSIGSRVAHELRNPLAAIKGLVQLLARKQHDAHDSERIAVVESEIKRMEAILRDYLSYSRPLEDLHLEAVDVGLLADDVVTALAGRAEAAGIRLQTSGSAVAQADRRRIKEALVNLVQNAIEATRRGGTVAVVIAQRDGKVETVIADDGDGIPPDVLARLGTPFFTTREHGTGLGVVLAKSIVAHHGGTLRYQSTVGRGTRVTIELPVEKTA